MKLQSFSVAYTKYLLGKILLDKRFYEISVLVVFADRFVIYHVVL